MKKFKVTMIIIYVLIAISFPRYSKKSYQIVSYALEMIQMKF